MRRVLAIFLLAAVVGDSTSLAAPPPETTPTRPEVVKAAISNAQRTLKEQLAKHFPADKIIMREEPGLFGTVVAVAAFPAAYPGTGVKRVPIDVTTGTTYGAHGERTLADFARERGWLAKAPAVADLARFLNTALFDGVAILDSEPPPRLGNDQLHGLTIELVRRSMPSLAGVSLVVTLPKEGPEVVEQRPLQRRPSP